jgi:hypothetical protein
VRSAAASLLLLFGLLVTQATGSLAAAQSSQALDAAEADALLRKIDRTLEARRWSEALPLIDRYLEVVRRDPIMLYNAACCHAQLGELDRGAERLLESVKAGFRDFGTMEEDPDLEPLRSHPTYTAILEARDRAAQPKRAPDLVPDRPAGTNEATTPKPAAPEALDLNTCPQLEEWKRIHGTKRYRFESDPVRRLHYATCLDEETHREMRALIERQADWLARHLFGDEPDYHTLLAVPTPSDAKRYFAEPTTTGIYEHRMRMLIARDIGESLQHEFVHLMHYGHMERLRQQHPIWIQEGLATLFEAYDLEEAGDGASEIRFRPNTRHNVIHRAVRSNGALPWPKLFALRPDDFMSRSAGVYPQVRSIFLYLADRGKLLPWYETYTKSFREDPTGAKALERVFGKPLADIERQWRSWVENNGPIDDTVRDGDASLGISITEIPGGLRIRETLKGSAVRASGMRVGDIIVAIDGKPVRTSRELAVAIAAKRVGETVQVRFRRDEEFAEVPVTLRPLRRS